MRGGSRPNAGRKPLFTDLERLYIGIQCEAAYNAAATGAQNDVIAAVIASSDYHQVIAQALSIPVSKRSDWLQSEEYNAYCADIEQERHAMARTEDDTLSGDGDDPPAPRILTIPRRRPYGIRKRIVADIATDWSHRIGKAVSGTTVIRCWEEYRALLKIVPEYQGSPPAV